MSLAVSESPAPVQRDKPSHHSPTRGLHQVDEISNPDPPDFDAQIASHALTLRGRKLTAALAFVAGTGFTLFGWVSYCCFHCSDFDTSQ